MPGKPAIELRSPTFQGIGGTLRTVICLRADVRHVRAGEAIRLAASLPVSSSSEGPIWKGAGAVDNGVVT